MPIYEYKCTDCDHRLEKLQKMSDDALKDCPECEEPALTKLISASTFKLKGTGWYETDFKGGNKSGKPSSSQDDSKNSSKSKTETKVESSSSAKNKPSTKSKSEVTN